MRPRIRYPTDTEKPCSACRKVLPIKNFHKARGTNSGYGNYCKPCGLLKQREKKRERKLQAIEYLGGSCKSCGGVFHPAVYEFHHLDPSKKDKDPSKMTSLKWSRLKAELDLCVLLCANCHRIEHHGDMYAN
jgi:hypothetical protein